MNEEQKQSILKNIRHISKEELFECYKKGLSLQKMKETQKLDFTKKEWLEEKIRELEGEKEDMISDWDESKRVNTVERFKQHLRNFPNSDYKQECIGLINVMETQGETESRELLNQIKNNMDDYTIGHIMDYINLGRLKKEHLFEDGFMTHDELDVLMNPPQKPDGLFDWSSIPELPNGNVDAYFFGMPGSGKSCVLAGLMHQAEINSILELSIDNVLGYRYCHFLISCIRKGIVPGSTKDDNEAVNFINCEFNVKDKAYPISFVEMSGEFFKGTYSLNNLNSENSINVRGFLKNENPKVIFFIIEYLDDNRKLDEIHEQNETINFVWQKLINEGVIERVRDVRIILTKSDRVQNKDMIQEKALDFLNDYYGSFMKIVKKDIQRYGINQANNNNLYVHPFSLGEFKFGDIFRFDNNSSNDVLEDLLKIIPSKRKKSIIRRVFG